MRVTKSGYNAFSQNDIVITAQTTTTTNASLTKAISSIAGQTFGHSVQGRAITGYIFGTGSEKIFMFGAMHGNERSSGTLMSTLVTTLSGNPSLVGANKKIVIIPISNPDGYFGSMDKNNANGVNLDRNFGTSDWVSRPAPDRYGGEAPFDQPETQAIRAAASGASKLFSYHAQGRLVNPENFQSSIDLARWYASKSGYTYFNDPSWNYCGTVTKWFMEATGNPAITIELPSYSNADWSHNKTAILEIVG